VQSTEIVLTMTEQKNFWEIEDKGFASTNVLGIGSYSLQFQLWYSRLCKKATYIEIGETGIEIFKDPITDDGIRSLQKV
jgi:hypothetical protein